MPPGRVLVVIVSGGGASEITAAADFVLSAALTAVTVTEVADETVAGAEYRPALEIVPTAGLTDQVTAAFVVPVTVTVNCRVCEAAKLAVDGLTVICTGGTTVTLAVAFLLVSATLVAVTVTVCGLVSVAGAK